MRIVTLGTGSPLPDANRAGPCTLVDAAGAQIMVDCGRGALMRAVGAGVQPQVLHSLLVTHLHSDHTTDLNDFITSKWALSLTPIPIRVVGPVGTQRLVDRTLAMLEDDISYRIAHHADLNDRPVVSVTEVSDGPIDLGISGLTVTAAPTDHAPVQPTVGYRFEAASGIAALAGDTVPTEGLDRLCQGADIYVQTTVRRQAIEAIGVQRLVDVLDYHSSIEDAAETAKRNGVKKLVMTHMVPAVAPDDAAEAEWASAARAIFDGEVVVARDLTEVVA